MPARNKASSGADDKVIRDAKRRARGGHRYDWPRGYPRASVSKCETCGLQIVAHEPASRGEAKPVHAVVHLLIDMTLPRLEIVVGDIGLEAIAGVANERQGRELSALIALHGGMLYRLEERPAPLEWCAVAVFPTSQDRDEATIALAGDTNINARVARSL